MLDMTDHEKEYSEIWVCLLFLLVSSISFSWLSVPHGLALILIFGISLLKAALVAKYFMHLTKEALLVMGIVVTPVLLLFVLFGLFWPDFGIRRTDVNLIPGYQPPAAHDSATGHH
jgi:caa(3)-type oxidase subunit IV